MRPMGAAPGFLLPPYYGRAPTIAARPWPGSPAGSLQVGSIPPYFIPQGFGVSPGPCQTPPGAGPDLAPQGWQRPVALSPPGFVPLWDNLDLWVDIWGLGVGFSSPEPAK